MVHAFYVDTRHMERQNNTLNLLYYVHRRPELYTLPQGVLYLGRC